MAGHDEGLHLKSASGRGNAKPPARARTLMVQGTSSSAGKSTLVTALCRIFRQDGYSVAPFKAQNMALNSYVTADGLEIGRSQAVQAEAAGAEMSVDMNPVLLKPEAEARSQVIVMGKPFATLSAGSYYNYKQALWPIVQESLERLRSRFEIVVIEGAGSPAEVNLREQDIVNMRVALAAEAPVILVGDIDRGGVFASLVGTLELLDPEERALVKAFAINKFRGDLSLLKPGLDFLENRTGVPVIGVVPYFRDIRIAEEDSVALEERRSSRSAGSASTGIVAAGAMAIGAAKAGKDTAEAAISKAAIPGASSKAAVSGAAISAAATSGEAAPRSVASKAIAPEASTPGSHPHTAPEELPQIPGPDEEMAGIAPGLASEGGGRGARAPILDIALVHFPHISNFDDFDPLEREPDVHLRLVESSPELGGPDLIILPGTKATVADLEHMRRTGLADCILALARRGTPVIGICGGYQMLGRTLRDPLGVESSQGEVSGLGLLPVDTTFQKEKRTCRVRGRVASGRGLLSLAQGQEVLGYEIHMGHTEGNMPPAILLTERSSRPVDDPDGAISEDGLVFGTYVHGLFGSKGFSRMLLEWLARRKGTSLGAGGSEIDREQEYDRLAALVRAAIDMDMVYRLIGLEGGMVL